MLPEVSKLNPGRQHGCSQLARRARHEHLPAMPGGCDAGGLVEREPDVVVADARRLPGVNPHPHANLATTGPRLRGERALRIGSGGDGIRRALEGEEHRVTLRAERSAGVGHGSGLDQIPLSGQHATVGVTELAEEAGRALDIGEQKGDCPGRELGHGR